MQPVMPVWIHFVVMFASAGLALWLGRREVKLVASCYMMTNMLLVGFGGFEDAVPYSLEMWLYVIEAACFASVALYFRRIWLLLPIIISLGEIATGFARPSVEMSRWLYATLQLGWFYALWVWVLVATLGPLGSGRRSPSPA